MPQPVLILLAAIATVAHAVAIPPAPDWIVNERDDGLTVSLHRAPWISFPLDGEDQAVIRSTSAALTREVGWPELPVYHLLFAVPPGCRPTLQATARGTLEHRLHAAPVGVWSITDHGLHVDRSNSVPDGLTGALYPPQWATIEPWGQFRGVQLYALDIRPLQQRLGTGQMVEHLGMALEITWDPSHDRGGMPIEPRYLPVLQSMVMNEDLAARVGTVHPASVPSSWEPPYPAVKITVPPNRPAVVHHADLAAVAPDLAALPPDELTLRWKGQDLPCIAETGTGGTIERITFLSPPLPDEYANETFHNVMWLGRGAGLLPMGQRDGTPQGAWPLVTSHPATLAAAEELEHSDYTSAGDALEWWWTHLETRSPGQVSSTNLSFSISTVDKTRPITLRVGVSADTWTSHRVRISIGGRTLADTTWTNKGSFEVAALVPPELMYVGTNVVKLESVGQSTTTDRIWVKNLFLDFSTTTAALDSLRFDGSTGGPGAARYRVDGFRYPDVTVLEVSDPYSPVYLMDTGVELVTGGYVITFGDSIPEEQGRRYLTFAPDRGASRPTLELRTAGVLGSATGADYLVLTNPLFLPQATRLAAHRHSRGLSTLVIDVNEIFDRFGYGYPSSLAVDDFVAWAYGTYSPRPGFVVLVGDGSARQRHGNEISPNLFPVRLISRVADENAYADVDGDPHRLPDVAIGRLSVQTSTQADDFVDKIIAAETHAVPSLAHARIAFFADDGSPGASQPGFAYDCEDIITTVSPAYFPERIYLSYNGGSNDAWNDRPTMLHSRAKGEAYYRPWILDTLRDGVLLLTYVGHGGINTFATEWIITTDDAPEMLTAPNYPFMTSFSCDTGRFDDPDYDIIMAEHFTRWREGALAFFSSSRESYPGDNSILSVNLHRALLDDGIHQIGLAAQVAKFQSDSSYLCRTYSLLGDPASELPIPGAEGLAASVSPEVVGAGTAVSGALEWQGVSSADVTTELIDAFGIPLASQSQTIALPWASVLATAEAPPPGDGAFRVYARSGAAEALTAASFTSPVNMDTAVVTPELGSEGYVASNNGNILVLVPPGCVDDTTVVRISIGSVTNVDSQRHMDVCPVPGSNGGIGRAYRVQFDSGELGQMPLDLRLSYDINWVLPTDVDSLMAAMWNPDLDLWVGLPSEVAAGRVVAEAPSSGEFTVLIVYDREPPIITQVEIQEGGSWRIFQEGEYASSDDWMRISLADHDGILGSALAVRVAGQSVPATYEATIQTQQQGSLLFQLPDLPGGSHAISIRTGDVYGNETTHNLTVRTGSGLDVAGFAAVPSPFTDETMLRFVLSQDAQRAVARVYTVSGRLIRDIELAIPTRGMNLMPWDGRDQDGDRIAGGVYLVRLAVEAIGSTVHAETKVVRRPS